MELRERVARLRLAGVEVLHPRPLADATVTPPDVAWSASNCGAGTGRVDRPVDDDDPDRIAKGNAAWLALARESGLFDGDGVFLLAVEDGPAEYGSPRWHEVRLAADWDLVGRGAEARVLGFGSGVPAFVMSAKDGRVLLAASWYESCFSVFAVPDPVRAVPLRQEAERLLLKPDYPEPRRTATRQWLDR